MTTFFLPYSITLAQLTQLLVETNITKRLAVPSAERFRSLTRKQQIATTAIFESAISGSFRYKIRCAPRAMPDSCIRIGSSSNQRVII